MEGRMAEISDYELIGQILDGSACEQTRQSAMRCMTNQAFEECFLLAMKATRLFDNKIDVYETVQ